MKKFFTLFILSICLCGILNAQNNSDTKAQINKIKRSSQYLSAEATMSTEEEALSLARELLVGEINDWVASKRNGAEVKQIVLQDINLCAQEMDMKRGIKTRAFVYVKKKDIVLIYGDGQIVLNNEENGADLQALSEINAPAQSDSTKNVAETQVADSVKVENEAAPVVKESVAEVTPLEQILAAKTMSDLKPVFASLKSESKINYGSYNAQTVVNECYLLFYTREGNIKAIVRKSGDKYTDAKDNSAKNIVDFSGCGAYWFMLK
ncbi:MAG: hypothetical protein IKJ31_01660 [Bacteroidaceae bacterium]|nr:hypothetical protein [Bacteroidaceae bacterium]